MTPVAKQHFVHGSVVGVRGKPVEGLSQSAIKDLEAAGLISVGNRADAAAKAEADRKAQEEADAAAKAEADRKAQEEADAAAKAEADRKAQEEADAAAKAEADRKAAEKHANKMAKEPINKKD